METSMMGLTRMTLLALLLGVAFGILYDILRITRVMAGVTYGGVARRSTDFLYSRSYPLIGKLNRKERRVKKGFLSLFVGVEDLIYCLLIGAALCIFLYYTNDGIFRWQAPAAAALGFFAYYKTIGAIIIGFAEIICTFLKIIAKILLAAIAFPFKIMYNIIVKVSKALFGVPAKWLRLKWRRYYTGRKMDKLLREADDGFLEKFAKGQGF